MAAPDEQDDAAHRARIRALASPVRMRILRLCLHEPRTNKELAAELEMNAGTMLHHVRSLVAQGFLRAEEPRRGTRGAKEVPYRATGLSWRAGPMPNQGQILLDTFLDEIEGLDPEALRVSAARSQAHPGGPPRAAGPCAGDLPGVHRPRPRPGGRADLDLLRRASRPATRPARSVRAPASRRLSQPATSCFAPASNSSRSPVSPALTARAADHPLVEQEPGQRDRADADLDRPRPVLPGDESLDDARDEQGEDEADHDREQRAAVLGQRRGPRAGVRARSRPRTAAGRSHRPRRSRTARAARAGRCRGRTCRACRTRP